MNGDSGDVNYLGEPLLHSTMSFRHHQPYVTSYVHTFVSSEGCHIFCESVLDVCANALLGAGLL